MQNLKTSQITPLALDFQKANKSFSSTKMKATQRYISELIQDERGQKQVSTKPGSVNELFSEIQGLLEDF